jgi:ribosomal protein S18 acetylase RimI-like enzyme
MILTVRPLPLEGPLFDGAMTVYGEAFAEPPYLDHDRGREIRKRLLDTHRYREGFRAFVAEDDDGAVLGMIYGYRGAAGQWWHDTVRASISPQAGREWLADSYELVEVAVAPGSQGRGIGQRLIAELLAGRQEATCVLSTRTDSRAHELYRRLGFEVIREMTFVPGGYPFYVMGKKLQPVIGG